MLAGIFILNILLALFLVYIIFDFLKAFDRIIYRKKHFYIVGYISFFLSILIGNYIYPSEFLNVLLLLIGTLIIGDFLYNNKKIYMLYYSLYIGFIIIIQIFVKEIFKLMITSKFINFYDPIIAEITLVILMIFLTLIASRIFINIYINKKINSFTKVQFFNFTSFQYFLYN